MNRSTRLVYKRAWSILLIVAMIASLSLPLGGIVAGAGENLYAPTESVEYNGVVFGRMTEAYNYTQTSYYGTNSYEVAGSPMFDGEEAHLDDFIELILSEMDDDDIIALTASGRGTLPQGQYINDSGTAVKYHIITGLGSMGDVGQAGETQWPNRMALAQSWNKELVYTAGAQYANEGKSKADVSSIPGSLQGASSTSGLVDIRANPLAGCYDEGYGEDSYMVGMFADLWGKGNALAKPYEEVRETLDDPLGVYSRTTVYTKHYDMYNSEFFRITGNYTTDVRSWYEYMGPSAARPFSSGAITGYMSSYGMTNGVPSTSSFIHQYARENSYEADDGYKVGFATGFDAYANQSYTAMQGMV